MPRTILVVGGAGFVGSHVALMLLNRGYHPIIFDNLSRGNRSLTIDVPLIVGDLAQPSELDKVFSRYPIDAVMHFAAYADVGESFKSPLEYYINNVCHTLCLIQAMLKKGVRYLIFSSSAAIFGLPQQPRIDEKHPCNPVSPYGQSKLMVEKILADMDKAHGLKSCCLRYFNAAGGDPAGLLKQRKTREHNLIPLCLSSLLNGGTTLTLNGADYPTPDGTCVRDYVHVNDIGAAHVAALEHLFQGNPSSHYNLGNGEGFSIKQVVRAIETVTLKKVPLLIGPRREGDPPILVANAEKAKQELGWNPLFPKLETMIEHAWQAFH